jgi:hypothetical protein
MKQHGCGMKRPPIRTDPEEALIDALVFGEGRLMVGIPTEALRLPSDGDPEVRAIAAADLGRNAEPELTVVSERRHEHSFNSICAGCQWITK